MPLKDYLLLEVSIRCEGEEKVIAEFSHSLKIGESEAIKEVRNYLKTAEVEYGKDYFIARLSKVDLDFPLCFKPILRDFPDIVFIFDICYEELSGNSGNGRYYVVYEKGKKVYDADAWLEYCCFLNEWLSDRDIEGDFYLMDLEEQKEAIAKGELVDRGEKITEDAVDELIETYDVYDARSMSVEPVSRFLVDDKDFFGWSRTLGVDNYFDPGWYGYEHYLELKREGKLPSFNAASWWSDFFELNGRSEASGADQIKGINDEARQETKSP